MLAPLSAGPRTLSSVGARSAEGPFPFFELGWAFSKSAGRAGAAAPLLASGSAGGPALKLVFVERPDRLRTDALLCLLRASKVPLGQARFSRTDLRETRLSMALPLCRPLTDYLRDREHRRGSRREREREEPFRLPDTERR